MSCGCSDEKEPENVQVVTLSVVEFRFGESLEMVALYQDGHLLEFAPPPKHEMDRDMDSYCDGYADALSGVGMSVIILKYVYPAEKDCFENGEVPMLFSELGSGVIKLEELGF